MPEDGAGVERLVRRLVREAASQPREPRAGAVRTQPVHRNRKRREQPLAVAQRHLNPDPFALEDILGDLHGHRNAGERHAGDDPGGDDGREQHGEDEKQEVVPGVDRGQREQQDREDVDSSLARYAERKRQEPAQLDAPGDAGHAGTRPWRRPAAAPRPRTRSRGPRRRSARPTGSPARSTQGHAEQRHRAEEIPQRTVSRGPGRGIRAGLRRPEEFQQESPRLLHFACGRRSTWS